MTSWPKTNQLTNRNRQLPSRQHSLLQRLQRQPDQHPNMELLQRLQQQRLSTEEQVAQALQHMEQLAQLRNNQHTVHLLALEAIAMEPNQHQVMDKDKVQVEPMVRDIDRKNFRIKE